MAGVNRFVVSLNILQAVQIEPTSIPDVRVVRPRVHRDRRGSFAEAYNADAFARAGIAVDFVQDNHSCSALRGTVRGLHFQAPPHAQHKLVRVVRGAVLDVAVDLRRGSGTYGRHVSVALSADDWSQLLVPIGFAHGFVTLAPDTEVLYKVSALYAPEHDRGILWNDPALGIDWPVGESEAVLSDKDRALPRLAEIASPFP